MNISLDPFDINTKNYFLQIQGVLVEDLVNPVDYYQVVNKYSKVIEYQSTILPQTIQFMQLLEERLTEVLDKDKPFEGKVLNFDPKTLN